MKKSAKADKCKFEETSEEEIIVVKTPKRDNLKAFDDYMHKKVSEWNR